MIKGEDLGRNRIAAILWKMSLADTDTVDAFKKYTKKQMSRKISKSAYLYIDNAATLFNKHIISKTMYDDNKTAIHYEIVLVCDLFEEFMRTEGFSLTSNDRLRTVYSNISPLIT
jgi:hypothetical protein